MRKYMIIPNADQVYDVLEINGDTSRVVYQDTVFENAMAMCEEYQYNAECHEWALYNSQESEFDYV